MADDSPKKLSELEEKKKEEETSAEPKETESGESKPEEETPEPEPPVEKKKRFGLPFFGKKKKEKETDVDESEAEVDLPEEPLTAEELVNDLDPDIKIHTQTKQARLAKVMNEHIETDRGNNLVFRFPKRRLLLFSGIFVITTWIVVISTLVYEYSVQQGIDIRQMIAELRQPEDDAEEIEEIDVNSRARIRDGSGGSEQVLEIADLLKDRFGFEYVEIIEDEEIEDETLTVYAKADAYGLLLELIDGLGEDYSIASGSAQLSEDSDFGVVLAFPETEE